MKSGAILYNLFQGLPVTTHLDAVPQLLIGLQDVALLEPLETRSGETGEPIAVRCPLGWAIYGPYDKVNRAAAKASDVQPAEGEMTSVPSVVASDGQPEEGERPPRANPILNWRRK
ncbi:hypothetical protein ZHAS_00000010 [Anopheles sinensis]|uniref:Uncharacterized protein n=1 Tax=Anopheles sinensis TaxID=74873 RepID=A0A084V9T2_ANOSI|nr:hypothetical protein ZHAS_00000010 [Anopheles sinensis]